MSRQALLVNHSSMITMVAAMTKMNNRNGESPKNQPLSGSFGRDRIKYKPHEYRVLFLKSWNEWAEGNYIEPDQINGRAFLEVIREANCK